MDNEDPMVAIFGNQDVELYSVLNLSSSASLDQIKQAYRRLALLCHPDKHTNASPDTKAEACSKFHKIGFAYAVLSDETRRSRYDKTGSTAEGVSCGEDGWDAYFEELFDRVTRGTLDEMKKEYQGSSEEIADIKSAYVETDGSIEDIMNHIPHSTHTDEARFVMTLSKLVSDGTLPNLPKWEASLKDEKAKLVRKKRGEKESEEAEKLAKELGVWEEFYGSGATGKRRGKGKGKAKAEPDEEDVSTLQALISKKKQQRNQGSFLDSLALKYTGTKRPLEDPDIDDDAFQQLQDSMRNKSSSKPPLKKKAKTKKNNG